MSTTLTADDLVIEIPPGSMTVAIDADGTPKTIPVEEAAPETVEADKVASQTLAELEQARKEREDAVRRAERAEADAQARTRAATEAQALAEQEREGRTKAEATVHERTAQAAGAHYWRVNSELETVRTGISTTKGFIEQAEQNLASAMTEGDHAKAARIQSTLSKANADLVALEGAQGQWGAELDRAKREYGRVVEQAPKVEEKPAAKAKKEEEPTTASPTVDPDTWINQWPRKTTGAWLKKNKDYVTDAAKHQELLKFANDYASDYGANRLHTPDFIEALNAEFFPEDKAVTTDTTKTEAAKEEAAPAKAAGGRAPTTAAPVSRGNEFFSSTNLNALKVKVPADVVQFCKSSGLKVEPYIEQVREDIKAGKLPKEWLDPGYDRGIR